MSELAHIDFEGATGQEMYTALSSVSRKYEENQSMSDMTGAGIVDLGTWLSMSTGKYYPLWSYVVGKSPLKAWVYKEGGYWFAEIDDLNVSGEGVSPREAISSLEDEVQHFREFYETSDDDLLVGYALELKQKFAEIVPQD